MAMKFISRLIVLSVVCLIVACATPTAKPSDSSAAAREYSATEKTERKTRDTVVDTKQFMPVSAVNAEGKKLPYKAQPNPYLSPSIHVSEDSLRKFDQAQQAFNRGDLSSADILLRDLAAIEKAVAGPKLWRGKVAEEKGDAEFAGGFYREAIAINPNNVNAYLALARVERQQGEFVSAQNTYAQALGVWKDFPEGHFNLAVLYDLYMNKPLLAQYHMEAYVFLTQGKNPKASGWLQELRHRTGEYDSLVDASMFGDMVVAEEGNLQ